MLRNTLLQTRFCFSFNDLRKANPTNPEEALCFQLHDLLEKAAVFATADTRDDLPEADRTDWKNNFALTLANIEDQIAEYREPTTRESRRAGSARRKPDPKQKPDPAREAALKPLQWPEDDRTGEWQNIPLTMEEVIAAYPYVKPRAIGQPLEPFREGFTVVPEQFIHHAIPTMTRFIALETLMGSNLLIIFTTGAMKGKVCSLSVASISLEPLPAGPEKPKSCR